MNSTKDIAIVILNYNGEKHLKKYLPSVVNHSSVMADIIIADNASTDDSISFLKNEFPYLKVIELSENYGFCKGYNEAIKQVKGYTYLVLLNSDVEVTENWLQPLYDALDADEKIACAQPKVLSDKQKELFEYAGAAGGYIDWLGYPFCRGRLVNHFEEDRGQYDNEASIFWATGAALFIRDEVFRKLGGLDEHFFAHMEEIDLCWRIHRAGYDIKCIPTSIVYHLGGGTLNKSNPFKTFLNHRNNLLMLYKNLPARGKYVIILIRLVLDGLSGITYLTCGSFKDFMAVIKAHLSFYALVGKMNTYPELKQDLDNGVIYRKSILIDVFFKKVRKFSALNFPINQK